MKADETLARKIHCIITLFCGHNSEPELTELVVRKHGMDWSEVAEFSYRTGKWRGRLRFTSTDGRHVDIPTAHFTHYQNLHFFSERKCLSCIDHFGFAGDICTGDIWSRDQRDESTKPTLLVIKSKRGEEVFEAARSNIALTELHPRTVINGNSRGMTYHYNISARAQVAKLFGIKIKDPLEIPTTTLDRATALIGIFNFWLSHHPRYKKVIHRAPLWAIKSYIYFFKGLQQFNLFLHRPFPPVMKISLIGATLSGNRGAEAMLCATIGRLRERMPDARFVIHSYFPGKDRDICKDLGVEIVDATPRALVLQYFPFAVLDKVLSTFGISWPRGWMPRGPRELKESRALIDLFGVSYADGREKFLPFNVLCNWPAMLMNKPVVKLSQAVGSFRGRMTRAVGTWMLRKCTKTFARGDETFRMASALDLGDRLDLAPDTAFAFEPEHALTTENPQYEEEALAVIEGFRAESRTVLVLSVSTVVRAKCARKGVDYEKTMAQVATHFLEKGYALVLFPNATREGLSTHHNNDLPVIEEITRQVGQLTSTENLLALTRDLNTASLRRILARCDHLVASRFHAMIAGLALGKPTMVLGWGHKYQEVLAQFGIEKWAIDYSDLTAEGLQSQIEAFIADSESNKRSIARHVGAVKERAVRQFEWLANYLLPKPTDCTSDAEEAA
jgi:colanic acid/amylovoran biosynthesis protein